MKSAETKEKAARLLADGWPQEAVARGLGVSDRTLRRWAQDDDFIQVKEDADQDKIDAVNAELEHLDHADQVEMSMAELDRINAEGLVRLHERNLKDAPSIDEDLAQEIEAQSGGPLQPIERKRPTPKRPHRIPVYHEGAVYEYGGPLRGHPATGSTIRGSDRYWSARCLVCPWRQEDFYSKGAATSASQHHCFTANEAEEVEAR